MKSEIEEQEVSQMIRRPKPGERCGPVESPFNDAEFKQRYPTLAAYLVETAYEDRAPRTTSTLLIFCENGILRMCVNDRDNNRSVFFTSECVEGLLMAAENALCSQTADWRTRGNYGNNQPKTPF
jgi:hypothetical protein